MPTSPTPATTHRFSSVLCQGVPKLPSSLLKVISLFWLDCSPSKLGKSTRHLLCCGLAATRTSQPGPRVVSGSRTGVAAAAPWGPAPPRSVSQGPWLQAGPTPGWVNWLTFPRVVGRTAAFSCYFQAGQRHPRGTGTGSLLDAKWGRRPSPSPRSLPSSGPLRVCNRRSCKQAGKRCQSSWEMMPGLSGSSSPFQASQGR